MEINIENIKAAYETATESEKILLSTLFPDLSLGHQEENDRPVTERIKTFDDALHELGESHPAVRAWRASVEIDEEKEVEDIEAFLRLRIICAALNEGWEPQFTADEWRWYPWFTLWTDEELASKINEWKQNRSLLMIGDKYQSEYAGLAFAVSSRAPSNAGTDVGSRLCLKSEELATYCGKQFIELWADFYLITKSNH